METGRLGKPCDSNQPALVRGGAGHAPELDVSRAAADLADRLEDVDQLLIAVEVGALRRPRSWVSPRKRSPSDPTYIRADLQPRLRLTRNPARHACSARKILRLDHLVFTRYGIAGLLGCLRLRFSCSWSIVPRCCTG